MSETGTFSRAKTLEQSREHSLDFKQLRFSSVVLGDIHQVQVPDEKEKVLKFAGGSHRNMQELTKFRASFAATPFRNICGNRTGCTPHLAAEPESFVGGQLPGELANLQNELVAATPHLEFSEVLHQTPAYRIYSNFFVYLQLNTKNCELTPWSPLC
ncbi:MAG: hypothetical protein WBL63_21455 [Candidatus Acidiferrum sp.]